MQKKKTLKLDGQSSPIVPRDCQPRSNHEETPYWLSLFLVLSCYHVTLLLPTRRQITSNANCFHVQPQEDAIKFKTSFPTNPICLG